MKECKECKRTEVEFYSKKHLLCIKCFNQKPIKPVRKLIESRRNPLIPLIKKKRLDCSQFILKDNKDYAYHNDLGCNYKKIRNHIEKQFQNGMSWQSHGGWHIDHIIPLSSAKSEPQLIKLLKWKNIQPLWAEANLRKKDGTLSQEKRDTINKKMSNQYDKAIKQFETNIVKTRTIDEMIELLKSLEDVKPHQIDIYARSIGYEREGDLFIKRRKL
jgi:hypothetical protein